MTRGAEATGSENAWESRSVRSSVADAPQLLGSASPSVTRLWRVWHHADTLPPSSRFRLHSMHPSYYYRAHACILVFDVTRKVTYQHLQEWHNECQQFRPGLPTLVVANKIDVDLNVTKQSFKFPQKNPACHPQVYFCSASDGSNVVKVFQSCIAAAQEYKLKAPETDFTEAVLETLDYFKEKEKTEGAAPAATAAQTPATAGAQRK